MSTYFRSFYLLFEACVFFQTDYNRLVLCKWIDLFEFRVRRACSQNGINQNRQLIHSSLRAKWMKKQQRRWRRCRPANTLFLSAFGLNKTIANCRFRLLKLNFLREIELLTRVCFLFVVFLFFLIWFGSSSLVHFQILLVSAVRQRCIDSKSSYYIQAGEDKDVKNEYVWEMCIMCCVVSGEIKNDFQMPIDFNPKIKIRISAFGARNLN